jgi:hypothetical protein
VWADRELHAAFALIMFDSRSYQNKAGLFLAPSKRVLRTLTFTGSVGADIGPAGTTVFRGDSALYRCLYIGVVKDDKWRVAAQFQ